MKRLCLFLLLLFPLSLAQTVTIEGQEYALEDQLPRDPDIRTGKLDNGLTYYVRRNTEPLNRADFALVIDAGSILEDDDQRGLAHFLEHMLFNGTESFEGQEIINFLERSGMEFGPDVNAYTSFDETVYTLEIPLDDQEVVDTSFQILYEWASKASLSQEEIDKEREVIVEEWRLRDQTMNGRLTKAIIPILLGDTRYAERIPIGDIETVRTAPREAFTRFYDNWYRPDLMAIVAVGDFDPAAMEEHIKATFSSLENPENAPERSRFDVPLPGDSIYYTFADPEFPVTAAQIFYKSPSAKLETIEDFKNNIIGSLFSMMLNTRLEEKAREADAPYLQASASSGPFYGGVDDLTLTVVTQEGQLETGVTAVLAEVKRIQDFGFTETELERAKTNLLTSYEENYKVRDDLDSSFWRDAMVDEFLTGGIVTSNGADLDIANAFLPQIGLEDVNELASIFRDEKDRAVVALVPQKEGLNAPTEADLQAWVEAGFNQEVEAYQDELADTELMTEIPEPVAITDETYVEGLDTTIITLENGIRVIMKPTDFTAEEVLVNGSSYGGASLVSDEDYPEASTISSIISDSGVAAYSLNQLERILAGKNVSVGVGIGNISEAMSGNAEKEDLETLFKLIYLYATQPRKDEAAFKRNQDSLIANLENRATQPNAVFQDAITESIYGDNIRFNSLTIDQVENLDYDRAFEIYQERFADMDDFTFTVVGDFDIDTVKHLAQVYLGNLPGKPGTETWRNYYPPLPQGVQKVDVYKGLEEQTILRLQWDGPFYNPVREERFKLFLLQGVLDIKMREKIREELAGSYSPTVFQRYEQKPSRRYTLGVQYTADPKRVLELIPPTLDVLYDLRDNGPDEDTLFKAKEQVKRGLEEALQTNSYWQYVLGFFYFLNPNEDPLTIVNYAELVDGISANDVQEMAQRFIVPDRYTQVILYPEAYQP
ncbi:MAG: insulinase family protein [Trueperaceae bacterium]|nr:insulinase family protein [Trueperaceae bacterium]